MELNMNVSGMVYFSQKNKSISSSDSSPILLLRMRLFPDYARVKRQRVLIRFSQKS